MTMPTKKSNPLEQQLPPPVIDQYEILEVIGQGGFAKVMLARHKMTGESVAIKKIRMSNHRELGQCHRELSILKEVHHPNIIQLKGHWILPDHSAAVMALQYAKGPTLLDLIETRGALSLPFTQVIMAQLVDAVAHLHTRAVAHRDIKPDNLIITGALLDQEEIWVCDSLEANLDKLRNRWPLKLVDFGFARALTPQDMKQPAPKVDAAKLQQDLDDSSRRRDVLSRSRHFIRKMSALGSPSYAAPEIIDRVAVQELSHHQTMTTLDVTHTLSTQVAYYGLQVDAYAIGRTMKYCLTGVPPSSNVEDEIALQNHPFLLLGRLLGCCPSTKLKFRRLSAIPKETLGLMKGLVVGDPQKRSTVQMARRSSYIQCVLKTPESTNHRTIQYLSFAKQEQAAQGSSVDSSNETQGGLSLVS